MSVKSPKEGPTCVNTPAFPITVEQLSAIMAEAPPVPLSPRSAQACADQFDGLTTDMLRSVVRGLVATLRKRDIERFAECNKQKSRIQELEDTLKKQFEVSYDMHTCPDGFEANDKCRAPYVQVPDKDGFMVSPKWVRYLDDGRIAAYAMGAPIDSMLYIVDIYAKPSLDDEDEPFEPMPQWFRAAMHADEAHWQVLYKEIYKMAQWGIAADLKRHQDLHWVIDGLAKKIEFMQVDLEGAWQTADLCEFRLQAAWAHKYAEHCQGLISTNLRFSRQNIQAIHIMRQAEQPNNNNNNNNNKNNKGKGHAA